MRSWLHDLRLAARSLARSPGLAAAAVLCFALGLGATCAVFSIVDAVLLRDLRCADPHQVVLIWGDNGGDGQLPLSLAELQAVSAATRSLARLAAAAPLSANLAGDGSAGEPLRLSGARVTAGFFPLLGVPPLLGRTLVAGDDAPGAPPVAVLSEGLWRDRFAAEPAVVGRKLLLDGEPVQVVGVMPAGFRFGGQSPQLWIPLAIDPAVTGPGLLSRNLTVLGRLRPGAAAAEARAELAPAVAGLRRENPRRYPERWALHLDLLRERLVGPARQPLLVLAAAVALVLLIAAVNVANLLLARAAARRREVVIRTALGAGRGGLVRQVLAENLLLALAGWGLGLLLAAWSVRSLLALGPEGIRRLEDAHVGLATAGFGLLAALLTALACGLPPLLQSWRPEIQGTLQDGGKGGGGLGRGGQRLLRALVAAEVAFAMVVLVGAGLLARSFWSLRAIDPGFRTAGILTGQLFLSPASYPEPRQRALLLALGEELARLPGASHGALTSSIPLLNRLTMPADVEGRTPAPGDAPPDVDWQGVSPGYFAALDIPLRRGRLFGPADHGRAPGVVLVDERLARQIWPGEEPLGKRLRLGRDEPGSWRTVVGVVAHVQAQRLDGESIGQVYTPVLQGPPRLVTLVVRGDGGDPLRLLPQVRAMVARLDPGLALDKVETLEEVAAGSLAARTSVLALLASFAAIALLLAMVGVYGVMAYTVAQSTRDLGLHMALGADARDVLRLVLRQGLLLSAAGVLAGSLGALAATRSLSALLYGISPTDLPTFAGLAVLLLAIALLASYLPARRAARIDPAAAFRS